MDFIVQNWDQIALIVTTAISLAAAIATVTPSKTDDEIVNKVLAIVNAVGLNIGKAKNKDAE